LKFHETRIQGLVIVEPRVFGDQRGFFKETFSERHFKDAGLEVKFVQDNVSRSSRGVLRGLHFQAPHTQGKLVSVLQGEVFDVAVDLRAGSKTFGKWEGVQLSAENHLQLYIPEGFAHGFLTLSETALFCYKCTDFYHPEAEHTLIWNDPEVGVEWPDMAELLISKKDQGGVPLSDLNLDLLKPSAL